MKLELVITTQSPTCPASGTGFASTIDVDVTHDPFGLPEIEGRRIKGLLAEAYLDSAVVAGVLGLENRQDHLFGTPTQPGAAVVGTARVEGYVRLRQWLAWAAEHISPGDALGTYTLLRTQTAVDRARGSAREHTLRRLRLLRRNVQLVAPITVATTDTRDARALALAALHLRELGLGRNRGNGRVVCQLRDDSGAYLSDQLRDELVALGRRADGAV